MIAVTKLSLAKEIAIHPLPVPKSRIFLFSPINDLHQRTNSSVSFLGIKTCLFKHQFDQSSIQDEWLCNASNSKSIGLPFSSNSQRQLTLFC